MILPIGGWLACGVALGLLLLLPAVPRAAGQPKRDTLAYALAAAYRTNPRIFAQRRQLEAANEKLPQAQSFFLPTITGRADYGASGVKNQSSFFSSQEHREPRSMRITVEQNVFRGFRTLAEIKEAENNIRAERARLLGVEQQVLLEAATAYVNVVRDQAILNLNIKNNQILSRRLQATRDRLDVGELTRTDVAQAEARLARALADRVAAHGTLQASRANYKNLIGEVPGKLKAPGRLVGLPTKLEQVVAAAIDHEPEVVAALFTERAARAGINKTLGELMPTVTVSGEMSRSVATSTAASRNTSRSVIARITVPLYQSGAVTSRLREAKTLASQRRIEIVSARRNAVEAATRSWENLRAARARIKAFESETRANEIALEGVGQEAEEGLRTVLDVLDAQQELLDSRVNLVGAQRDATVAGFEVWAAMGRLTARDRQLAVELHDVEKHYRRVDAKFYGIGGPAK